MWRCNCFCLLVGCCCVQPRCCMSSEVSPVKSNCLSFAKGLVKYQAHGYAEACLQEALVKSTPCMSQLQHACVLSAHHTQCCMPAWPTTMLHLAAHRLIHTSLPCTLHLTTLQCQQVQMTCFESSQRLLLSLPVHLSGPRTDSWRDLCTLR